MAVNFIGDELDQKSKEPLSEPTLDEQYAANFNRLVNVLYKVPIIIIKNSSRCD